MPAVTVAGTNSQTVTLNFDTDANAALARQLAGAITAGVRAGTIVPAVDTNGPPPLLGPGTTGEFIQTLNGTTFLPPGYAAVVDTASKAIIFGSGDPSKRCHPQRYHLQREGGYGFWHGGRGWRHQHRLHPDLRRGRLVDQHRQRR
jgi:hypothetical protein